MGNSSRFARIDWKRGLFVGGLLACAGAAFGAENIGKKSDPLGIDKTVKLFTANGNVVPVCWVTGGYAREKTLVRQAVTDTWEYYANVRFTGWGACPGTGTVAQVRVGINPQGTVNSGAGGSAALGMNAMTKPAESPAVNLSFNPDGSADLERVEYVGVHEFGHVLGFVHEQDLPGNVEGPAHCDKTKGVDPNGQPVTKYDRDSVMNYCNRNGNNNGIITDVDIAGVQSQYGARRRFAASLAQLHASGEIWHYTGRPCNESACPGWERIDMNPRSVQIAAQADALGNSTLFQRHDNGDLWKWDGATSCSGTACPGWVRIDSNPRTADIAATPSTLFQRHANGDLWKWDGKTPCTGTACPGWVLIDHNPRTEAIAAGGSTLFQRQDNGTLWRWDGATPCSGSACPGWTMIDRNPLTREIVAAGNSLFQRHDNGNLWRWDGKTACTATGCPGWVLIDMNPRTKAIAAAGKSLYERHDDGRIWRWDGSTPCTGTSCPGWTLIDMNPRSIDMVASGYGDSAIPLGLFQRHADGNLWRWDGITACTAKACPGWTLIDRDSRTKAMVASGLIQAPSRLSAGFQ